MRTLIFLSLALLGGAFGQTVGNKGGDERNIDHTFLSPVAPGTTTPPAFVRSFYNEDGNIQTASGDDDDPIPWKDFVQMVSAGGTDNDTTNSTILFTNPDASGDGSTEFVTITDSAGNTITGTIVFPAGTTDTNTTNVSGVFSNPDGSTDGSTELLTITDSDGNTITATMIFPADTNTTTTNAAFSNPDGSTDGSTELLTITDSDGNTVTATILFPADTNTTNVSAAFANTDASADGSTEEITITDSDGNTVTATITFPPDTDTTNTSVAFSNPDASADGSTELITITDSDGNTVTGTITFPADTNTTNVTLTFANTDASADGSTEAVTLTDSDGNTVTGTIVFPGHDPEYIVDSTSATLPDAITAAGTNYDEGSLLGYTSPTGDVYRLLLIDGSWVVIEDPPPAGGAGAADDDWRANSAPATAGFALTESDDAFRTGDTVIGGSNPASIGKDVGAQLTVRGNQSITNANLAKLNGDSLLQVGPDNDIGSTTAASEGVVIGDRNTVDDSVRFLVQGRNNTLTGGVSNSAIIASEQGSMNASNRSLVAASSAAAQGQTYQVDGATHATVLSSEEATVRANSSIITSSRRAEIYGTDSNNFIISGDISGSVSSKGVRDSLFSGILAARNTLVDDTTYSFAAATNGSTIAGAARSAIVAGDKISIAATESNHLGTTIIKMKSGVVPGNAAGYGKLYVNGNEVYAMDAAGNSTQLSSHPDWVYDHLVAAGALSSALLDSLAEAGAPRPRVEYTVNANGVGLIEFQDRFFVTTGEGETWQEIK